jgi:hypothetical protein
MLLKIFCKIEREGMLQNSAYKAKPVLPWHQNWIRKQQKENCRPISLMIIDTKILNETLKKWIQQHIKIIQHDQIGLIPGMRGRVNLPQINKCNTAYKQNKYKNHMIISII